jgi:hypothetical protein
MIAAAVLTAVSPSPNDIKSSWGKSQHLVLRALPFIMLVYSWSLAAQAQFSQQAKLVGTGVIGPYAAQGFSVSLSRDGNTAVVGGDADNNYAGAAWVYTRSGQAWSQQAKLIGTGAIVPYSTQQGFSVSLSDDGNTAIVGAVGDNSGIGAAWVFTRSGDVWTQQAKLIGAGAIGAADQGYSVSLSGDGNTAIVGGAEDNDEVGAAWVFTRSDRAWSQQAKLVGTGALGNARQGVSVSLSDDGNTAIVGAPHDNGEGIYFGVGAAWVFARSGHVWRQQAKLVGTEVVGSAWQGQSVSLSGDGRTAIIGGFEDNNFTGAAWVFTRSGSAWNQQAKLVGTGATGNANQGQSVALSGDRTTAIAGGYSDDNEIGAAWVFAQPVFAGTPGKASCHGQSVSALARQHGGLNAAAAALGYASVEALQNAILAYCEG